MLKRPILTGLSASVATVLAFAITLQAPPAEAQQGYPSAAAPDRPARARTRVDDAYRPSPDQPGLGVLGGRSEPDISVPGPAPYAAEPPVYSAPVYGAPSYGGSVVEPPVYAQQSPYPQPGGQPYGGPPQRYQPPYGAGATTPSNEPYRPVPGGYAANQGGQGFGQPYNPPQAYDDGAQGRRPYMSGDDRTAPPPGEYRRGNSFSMDEIKSAGHDFFGSITQGLASVIEHTHRKKGRPNGYILGEEAGGAFVAGLRYGRGRLYTKDAGVHNIYWQGPSLGFDAGAAGSKVMILVYNLQDVGETFDRFGGIDGSAYVIGGVGVTFLSKDNVIMAPIRSGVGLRLGANVGYLKFTRQPTWNPF